MNLLYIDQIEENISIIEKNGGFDNRFIVVFGANKPSEKMITALQAKNIKVDCVIDNNPDMKGKFICGVAIYTPEQGLEGKTKQSIVLIASKYFNEMKKQLLEIGCQEKQIYQMVVYQKFSTEEAAFDEAKKEIIEGRSCYNRLADEFGSGIHVIMCPYNGIGDMYFIGSYLPEYCKRKELTDVVVTVVSNTCFRVAKMFNISHVRKIEQKESDALMKYASFLGEKTTHIKVFTHTSIHWDILNRFENIDWGIMFRNILMGINDAKKCIPIVRNALTEAEKFMYENNLEVGRTAIVSPYANTIVGMENSVWYDVIQCLKDNGYDVYTNSIGENEPVLLGTKAIAFPIEIAREVVELAGVFVGIRSGLCDVIEAADAKIFVLYPDSRQMFFKLKSMGFGERVYELDCEKDDAIGIISKVIS